MRLVVGGVPEHFNWPFAVLLRRGVPAELELEWRDYAGGSGAMAQALNEGELDVALMLTEGAVAAIAKGGLFRVVSVYTQSSLVWGIHVPAASTLRTLADLRGHRYAISRHGSGSHLIAAVHARQQRWPEPLSFVEVGGLDGAVAALGEGLAEVFFWEKSMTQPLVDAGRFRRVGEFAAPWPAFVACASLAVLAERAADVRRLLDAALAAAADVAVDPGSAAAIARHYSLEPQEVAAWLERTRWAERVGVADELVEAAAALEGIGLGATGFAVESAVARLA
jgi:ABC-type nitrate/sulfonate/bicarbonate transport system substrate-binding protein